MPLKPQTKLSTWLKIIAWFAFLILILFFSLKIQATPLYKTKSLNQHKLYTWYQANGETLIGDKEIQLYARSNRSNFVIYDQDKNLVCAGTPTDFLPGEADQPFECNFKIVSGLHYFIQGYANLYTQTPESITFQTDRIGSFVAINVVIIVIIISLILLFVWFVLRDREN